MRTKVYGVGPGLAMAALSLGGMLLGNLVACSSEGGGHTLMTNQNSPTQMGTAGTVSAAGTTGTGGAIGAAGTAAGGTSAAGTTGAAGNGGAPAGGAGGAATGGAAGTDQGGGGAGGGGGGASGGAGGSAVVDPGFTGPFDCTLVAGLLITREWYTAGFENDGVDGDKWEGKFQHYGYIDIWAQDPPGGFAWDAAIEFACTAKSTEPDRVLFTAWSWEIYDNGDGVGETQYVTTTAAAVEKFKANYPSMKRLELISLARCPADPADATTADSGKHCNPNAQVPPIVGTTDHNAGQQDCFVPAYVDRAFQRVADMYPGLVYVGPKVHAEACNQNIDGAHLGGENNAVAQSFADYYKNLP